MFCLSDGTPLVEVYPETEEPTLVRPAEAVPQTRSVPFPAQRSGGLLKYAAIGVAVLLLAFAGAAAAIWLMWPAADDRTAAGVQNSNIVPQATPAKSVISESSPTPTPTKNKPPVNQAASPTPQESSPEPPQPPATDPAVTRITFKRGSVGESMTGTVNERRSFVLRTLPGQFLSASVQSQKRCVSFESGGANTAFETEGGDTMLTIRNKCDTPSGFRLNVNVR
jgi:type IV secretory pathway VirB10-like protein